MTTMKRQPSHPGYILKKDYLEPLNISITGMSETLGVSRKTLSKILNGRGSVTPDMALRLSRALNTTPRLWLNLQNSYDLWQAEHLSSAWKDVRPLTSQALNSV
ncbi:HigA family addiction module antitoxin [Desulfonatronospira sp.]|uniref:HigA family addiction module antitoxin n=1 Tax=Desulfonatronospira sp. TaxID=1962951 RepID=UPI0025C35F87|nr:HigA family addiction module antitoxin [Desulfonatronospira sp.]